MTTKKYMLECYEKNGNVEMRASVMINNRWIEINSKDYPYAKDIAILEIETEWREEPTMGGCTYREFATVIDNATDLMNAVDDIYGIYAQNAKRILKLYPEIFNHNYASPIEKYDIKRFKLSAGRGLMDINVHAYKCEDGDLEIIFEQSTIVNGEVVHDGTLTVKFCYANSTLECLGYVNQYANVIQKVYKWCLETGSKYANFPLKKKLNKHLESFLIGLYKNHYKISNR